MSFLYIWILSLHIKLTSSESPEYIKYYQQKIFHLGNALSYPWMVS